jgi:hypothetical protein
MSASPALPAFSAYGIELEYMIVGRSTLAVRPIADELLRRIAGHPASDVVHGDLGWSNELVLHVIELKNVRPTPLLEALPVAFAREIRAANEKLDELDATLMPTGMHPWMDPRTEARLWPHDNADIYGTFDRIFDCRTHGWANLQSMHINLPFRATSSSLACTRPCASCCPSFRRSPRARRCAKGDLPVRSMHASRPTGITPRRSLPSCAR